MILRSVATIALLGLFGLNFYLPSTSMGRRGSEVRVRQDVLSELVIYSAALGLAVSAVVARYTYYYIFSSVRLRRR